MGEPTYLTYKISCFEARNSQVPCSHVRGVPCFVEACVKLTLQAISDRSTAHSAYCGICHHAGDRKEKESSK
jgi:hypothetical protein